ncbi:30S ribosomal protein S9 [archaeon]|nr:30S ribosomal protein S9 [archaeon]
MTAKKKLAIAKAKKKNAVARVRIKQGKSSYKINGVPIENYNNELARETLMIPITIATQILGEKTSTLDIDVNVSGGGIMGQAEASQVAVAKALVEYSGSDKLKKALLDYDRTLLVDDVRRKEPKKYLRKGARGRPQKSYR